jgi:hypothetical protein
MYNINDIKELVKDKNVRFLYYREKELWYATDDDFAFPVPIDDVGSAFMKAEDKAILFMRWIRKHINNLEEGRNDLLHK